MLKKIILMFAGAVFSFFIFAYIDEYDTLIAPFLQTAGPPEGVAISSPLNEEEVRAFLLDFNKTLTEIYRDADFSKVAQLPATEPYKQSIYEELGFNAQSQRTVEMELLELVILRIDRLEPPELKVRAREKVRLKKTDNSTDLPGIVSEELINEVTYSLVESERGFMVSETEVIFLDTVTKKGEALL